MLVIPPRSYGVDSRLFQIDSGRYCCGIIIMQTIRGLDLRRGSFIIDFARHHPPRNFISFFFFFFRSNSRLHCRVSSAYHRSRSHEFCPIPRQSTSDCPSALLWGMRTSNPAEAVFYVSDVSWRSIPGNLLLWRYSAFWLPHVDVVERGREGSSL
jgi:hypothetical protein